MKTFILFISLLSFLSCKNDSERIANTPDTDKSIIETKDKIVLKSNYYKHYYTKKNEHLILKINQVETVFKNSDKTESELKISPYKQNQDWTIKTKAQELSVNKSTLTTKFNANSKYEDTYSLYNIETGKHLLDYTYGNLKAIIPGSDFVRYIGFTSALNAKNLLKKHGKNVIGIVTYASEERTLSKFLLKSKKEIDKITPDLELVSLTENAKLLQDNRLLIFMDLESPYKKEAINFAFGLTYYIGENSDESAIMFVVKNDDISLINAKYDKNIFEITKL